MSRKLSRWMGGGMLARFDSVAPSGALADGSNSAGLSARGDELFGSDKNGVDDYGRRKKEGGR
jgi:hypothetical protein